MSLVLRIRNSVPYSNDPESIVAAATHIWEALCAFSHTSSLFEDAETDPRAADLPSVRNYRNWDNYDVCEPNPARRFASDFFELHRFCERADIKIEFDVSEFEPEPEPEQEASRVSAGELRARGIDIPPDVPDCAWVPSDSIHQGPVRCAEAVGYELVLHSDVRITSPFTWVSVVCTVTKDGANDGQND